MSSRTFYEFFAGGGMARLGLGRSWRCLFANDISPKKAEAYRRNFSAAKRELCVDGIENVTTEMIPSTATLAWASFPCQDLSLAGNRAGLRAGRSGTFWPFWQVIESLASEGRGVPIVVLENVVGALTSHNGRDFASIMEALAHANYRAGAVVLDAAHFVPQSRPRLFVIAARAGLELPSALLRNGPDGLWHSNAVVAAKHSLSRRAAKSWLWWRLPNPPKRRAILSDILEEDPESVRWHSRAQTQRILEMMAPLHREKVRRAQRAGTSQVGTVYKRTRPDGKGGKLQRAEVRFDQVSGCLRTPAGGSSRQTILLVSGRAIRSRLVSAREAARLMGVRDTYQLPTSYNDAYHLMGDGVAVPVVRWLARVLLNPMAAQVHALERMAAAR